jgi:beta-glucosidase
MSSAVMAAYNKVNGTWSSEQPMLLTDILRREWNFKGFVMSDWGGTHSGVAAITAGLDLEMPSGRNFEALADAVKSGALPIAVVDQSVRRILTAMQAVGLLNPITPRPVVDVPATSAIARDIATAGAVLLKNDGQLLPLLARDRVAVIGPTGRSLLVGGGGSAHVTPMHSGSVLDALRQRMTAGEVTYAVGYDIEGTVVPATALALRRASASGGEPTPDSTIDFTGARALAAGSSWTWTGTITAPSTGDYVLKLQTAGGRGTLTLDTPPPSVPAPGGGRGRGGRGGGGAAGLLATADGLSNPSTPVHFDAGVARPITITATAADTDAMQLRLAWLTPSSATDAIAEAVGVAKAAHTAIVFAYDEGQEGRDRASLSLPGSQDALIAAVAAANPRTAVVLNNGAPVLMPWVDRVSSILQMWYPGQEGADATMALIVGDASPSGRLPVTFPRRVEDVPTNSPKRYPGVDGHGRYSEGIYVGYRWYDQQGIAPLFPFGHGLSYTNFEYSKLDVTPRGDGFDVVFTLKNAGTRTGIEVPQLYVGRPAAPPAPMAERRLVQFERVGLAAGSDRRVSFYINRDALSYWSAAEHRWVVATGTRAIMVGASSRDIRLRTDVNVK